MNRIEKPIFGLMFAVAVVCVFRIAAPSSFDIKAEKSEYFEMFPKEIGIWSGTDTEVDEATYRILETKNVLSREYKDPAGRVVYLLLVASKQDRRVAHPPEVCYLSSNFEILEKNSYAIKDEKGNDVPVTGFLARPERRPEETQQVLYLYKVGPRYTTNYYSQQLRFALDNLSGSTSQVYLIRLAGQDKDVLEEFLPGILEILESDHV